MGVFLSCACRRPSWQVKAGDVEGAKTLFGATPIRPEQIPVSMLAEVLGAMIKATEEIFGYVEIWESRKGLPLGQARDLEKKDDEPEEP